MKKAALVLLIPAMIVVVSSAIVAACSNSNVVPCESDTDCADLTDTPVCDADLGQCVAEGDNQCTEDIDCQIRDGATDGNPNDVDPTTCDADDDCATADDEVCVKGHDDEGFCLILGDDTICGAGLSKSLHKLSDDSLVDVCVGDGSCNNEVCNF